MGNKVTKIKKLHEDYYYYEFLNNRDAIEKLQNENSVLAKHRGLPALIPSFLPSRSFSQSEKEEKEDYRFLFVRTMQKKYIHPAIMIEMIKTGYLLPEYESQKKYSYYFFEQGPSYCDICGEYPATLFRSSHLSFSFSRSEKETRGAEERKRLCEKCQYNGSPLKQILEQNYDRENLEMVVRVLLDYYEVPLIDFKGLDICLPLNKFEEFARIKARSFEKELPKEQLPPKFFRNHERNYIRVIHTEEFKELLRTKKKLSYEEIISFCEIF
jgi:hypothetical protein